MITRAATDYVICILDGYIPVGNIFVVEVVKVVVEMPGIDIAVANLNKTQHCSVKLSNAQYKILGMLSNNICNAQ